MFFYTEIKCRFQIWSQKYKILNFKFYPIDLYRAKVAENSAKMGKISCQKNYFEKK